MLSRATTTIVLNSAYFDSPAQKAPHLALPARAPWSELHAPIAFFIGGPKDIAYAPAKENFSEIENLPVFIANLNVGHTGAYPGPNADWTRAVLAWLDWQLKRDRQAALQFRGSKCGLCLDQRWTEVKGKNFN